MNPSMLSCFVSSYQLGLSSCTAVVHNILCISTSPGRVVPSWRISVACTTGHGRFVFHMSAITPAWAGSGVNPLTAVNMLVVDLALSEGDSWPDVLPLPLVTRRRLGGPPGVMQRPQCCPTGWNNARAALMVQCCSGEAGPSCAAEPALLLPAPPSGLVWDGYQLLRLAC